MRRTLANIWHLGVKELWGLWRDPAMLVLIVFLFGYSVYSGARAMPETLNRAPIAIVDEDASPLSNRIAAAFYPPHFLPPVMIGLPQLDRGMDAGIYTFALVIPVNFQRDVLAGHAPALQLNVDATRMSQAFNGAGSIQQIVQGEIIAFVQRHGVGESDARRLEVGGGVSDAARLDEIPTVDPRKVGGLDGCGSEAGQGVDHLDDARGVGAQGVQQRHTPRAAVPVGGLGCGEAQHIHVGARGR